MKTHRLVAALAALNLVLVGVVLVVGSRAGAGPEPETAPVLRTRALELVDERGRVRSRINTEPGGEVVLRLLDEKGTIRVKLGASETGSGLILLDEATEPAVHIVARRKGDSDRPATTSITLRGASGPPRVFRPE